MTKGDEKMNKIDEYLNYYKNLEFYHRAYKTSHLRKEFDRVKEEEANLIDKIAKTSNIELYQAIYYYLAWNGYFSADRNFTATSKTSTELNVDFGIAIACGNGCCRNFALHFKSLIELLDRNTSLVLVGTKYHYKKESMYRTRKIKQKADTKSLQTKRKLSDWKYPNHIEVLDITTPQKPQILDPFNFDIQQLSQKNDSLLRRKMIDFGVSVFLDLDMDRGLREEIVENAERLERILSRKVLEEMPIDKRKSLCEEAIDLCESKKDLLEKRQERLNPTYQYIKRETRNFQSKGF